MSCGGSCMKILLIIFNIIFFITGAVVLAVGIWLRVDPDINTFFTDILPDESDPLWGAATIILITVGAITLVVGFLGCCGAMKESPCMLVTYGSLVIVILVAEIVGGVLAVVFKDEIEEKLEASMVKQIPEVKPTYAEGGSTNQAWHFMQYELKCCGAKDHNDYKPTDFPLTDTLPKTCCKLNNNDYKNPEPENETLCFAYNTDYMHGQGCYNALLDYIKDKSIILIGIGIGIGLVQIFGIVFAFCLYNETKNANQYA